MVTEQVAMGINWGPGSLLTLNKWKSENLVIIKRTHFSNFIVDLVLQWIHWNSDTQRFAELTPLLVAQTMMQCLPFSWYDAFHKGQQNFIKILQAR